MKFPPDRNKATSIAQKTFPFSIKFVKKKEINVEDILKSLLRLIV